MENIPRSLRLPRDESFARETDLALDIREILNKHNPMRMDNPRENEYFPEAGEISPLLPMCNSAEDVTAAVHQVFVRYFAPRDAGPRLTYSEVSSDIWQLWLKFKGDVTEDEDPKITALRARAELGEKEALVELGSALCNGDGVARNIEEGSRYVELAAEQGFGRAQFVLGQLYEKWMLPGGLNKAIEWYERAANQDHLSAQYVLGFLHTRASIRDFQKAAFWYEKAAAGGQIAAQRDLGVMYLRGDGVPVDYTKARLWLERAARQGNQEAVRFLKQIPDTPTELMAQDQVQENTQEAIGERKPPAAFTQLARWLRITR